MAINKELETIILLQRCQELWSLSVGTQPGLQGKARLLWGAWFILRLENKPVANQVEGREELPGADTTNTEPGRAGWGRRRRRWEGRVGGERRGGAGAKSRRPGPCRQTGPPGKWGGLPASAWGQREENQRFWFSYKAHSGCKLEEGPAGKTGGFTAGNLGWYLAWGRGSGMGK